MKPDVSSRPVPLPSARAAGSVLAFLVLAFGLYVRVWPDAPYVSDDTPSYTSLAADLKHFTLRELHGRTPVFPLFLIMTGADGGPIVGSSVK